MWHQFDDAQACTHALVTDLRFLLEKAIIQKDHAVLAVSGGQSAASLFDALSALDIEWDKVHITLVDERYVPTDHADSNERLVREHLLRNHAANAGFTGLAHQGATLDDDVKLANQNLPEPDVVVLGMGDDGHTASLFPYAPQLAQGLSHDGQDGARYIHVSPPDAAHERISMTLGAVQKAEGLILEIRGAAKRDVFERASLRVSNDYPISYLLAKSWSGAPVQVYWHP